MKWKTSMWTQAYGVYFSLHSFSCSSSWPKLFGKSGIYQELTREVCEPVASSDLENDHWPNWNYWNHNDWLAAALVERDDPADRQSCSVCNFKNLRLFWLRAKSGRYQIWTSHSMGQQDLMFFWKHVFSFSRKNWIWSTETNGVPVKKCPSILYIGNSRRDSKDHDYWIKVWTSAFQKKTHQRLVRLCALCGEKWNMILLQPGREKLNGIRKTITTNMNRIDGIPTEFKWKIFPRITTLDLLEKIQRLMTDLQCEPEDFTDKIIFMSMYNDIEWRAIRNKERKQFTDSCKLCSQIPSRSLVFLGAWIRREVVRNLHWPTRRMMVKFLRIWSPNISSFQCLWERWITKQWKKHEVNTLQW